MKPITYPLIDLGDGFPASKSSIGLFDSADQMGLCNHLAIMGGCFSSERRFYDRDGHTFKITGVTPEPQISEFRRFLAHVCYNPIKRFQVELGPAGEADLGEMKERIRELLENDPGDLLYHEACTRGSLRLRQRIRRTMKGVAKSRNETWDDPLR